MGLKRSRLVLTPDEYRNERQKVLMRDGWRCRLCRRRNNLHVHHIVYRSHGGDDASWNLITICDPCHECIHRPSPGGVQLILLPMVEGERINADDKIRVMVVSGSEPLYKVA